MIAVQRSNKISLIEATFFKCKKLLLALETIDSAVFTRIVATATINFVRSSVRLLIEGGSYSRATTINFALSSMRLLIEGSSYSRAATINFI